MRVLIIHNILWAHYKSLLFSELQKKASDFDVQIHVAQIAVSEKSRVDMGRIEQDFYQYDYTLLFDDALENVRLWPKIKAVFKVFKNIKPDLLNITGYYDPAQVLLLFWAKLHGVKVVISSESNARHNPRQFVKEIIKKTILKIADGFICFGSSSTAYFLELGIQPNTILTNKAAVVDNDLLRKKYEQAVINKQQLKVKLQLPQYNFMYVGRLIELKNLLRLLDCFSTIQSQNWGLILLGEGDQKPDLERFIASKNIQNITFLKGVNWYEVSEAMALADVFVLASTSEAWGLVVNEAMVCGLPVLVSDCCGCVEDLVKNNENGFVFDPYNKEELTEKLNFFVQNTEQIKPMGEVSREIVTAFSPQSVALEILTGFRRLGGS
jgi:glycosyltransferase involved in cell wall biosynthesis